MAGLFHFFFGNDDYLVDRAARECFERLAKNAGDDFSREIIDAGALRVGDVEESLGQFVSAVQTLSLFGEKKYVWLRGMTWLADSVLGRAEGTKACLAQLQATLDGLTPESAEVVISASPADGRTRETKWLEKNGNSQKISIDGKNPEVLAGMIAQECESLGVRLSHEAREALIGKVAGNSRLILEELRKLACYVGEGGGEITPDMILRLVPNFGEGDFFEPVEAFFSGNIEWALDALRRFFYHEPDAGRGILSQLQNRNRLLIQIGAYSGAKMSFKAAAANFEKYFPGTGEKSPLNVFSQNEWYVGNKVAPAARLFSLPDLIDNQFAFVGAFEEILSRPNEQESVMRELFVRCLSGRR